MGCFFFVLIEECAAILRIVCIFRAGLHRFGKYISSLHQPCFSLTACLFVVL